MEHREGNILAAFIKKKKIYPFDMPKNVYLKPFKMKILANNQAFHFSSRLYLSTREILSLLTFWAYWTSTDQCEIMDSDSKTLNHTQKGEILTSSSVSTEILKLWIKNRSMAWSFSWKNICSKRGMSRNEIKRKKTIIVRNKTTEKKKLTVQCPNWTISNSIAVILGKILRF